MNNNEEKIIAKGLNPPGPLLIVKKKLQTVQSKSLRIIVSSIESAEGLVDFFKERNAEASVDRAGDDFHVVVDLTNFKDRD
ncbi:MAG: hypothetical protein KAX38_04260 [Candidatus Krumholzibacteria bacterium]|nr:hypothetical protein [Candidatus Krumholzibacteria bacterium]